MMIRPLSSSTAGEIPIDSRKAIETSVPATSQSITTSDWGEIPIDSRKAIETGSTIALPRKLTSCCEIPIDSRKAIETPTIRLGSCRMRSS